MSQYKMAVAVCGNLSEGFTVVGPFESFGDAAIWAEGQEAWVTGLELPTHSDQDLAFMEKSFGLTRCLVRQSEHGPGLCEADEGRLSDRDYVGAAGQDCPNCGAACTMIAEGQPEIDGAYCTQTAVCTECDKVVTDFYELRGYRAEDEGPDGERK